MFLKYQSSLQNICFCLLKYLVGASATQHGGGEINIGFARSNPMNKENHAEINFSLRQLPEEKTMANNVNHPKHYNDHPSGVECITVTEHMNFNLGNAIKYIWRHSLKNGVEDLEKARWYLDREIKRLHKGQNK